MSLFKLVGFVTVVVVAAWLFLPMVEIPGSGDSVGSAGAGEFDGGSADDGSASRFGVLLDAGSSGTRVYVFQWEAGQELTTLREVTHRKISPGVSSYAPDGDAAFKSIEPLLKFAADNIPDDQVSQSPLLLQATAGMRLLPKSDADSVFAGLRRGLAKTAFSFTPEDAHLVDGGVEGRYLFAALNTALGKLQQATTADDVVGTLDLGGGSTQIAFPSTDETPHKVFVRPCVTAQACAKDSKEGFSLYAVSRLHFGMYKSFNDLIASKYTTDGTSPCMFPGQEEVNTAGATITGSGDYDACLAIVRKFVAEREGTMEGNPDTSTQPPLPLERRFYATDNFPKVAIPIMEQTGAVARGTKVLKSTMAPVMEAARTVCTMPFEDVLDKFAKVKGARRKKLCFGAAYIVALTATYGFPEDYEYTFALDINGQDTNWPLGSMMERIGGLTVAQIGAGKGGKAEL